MRLVKKDLMKTKVPLSSRFDIRILLKDAKPGSRRGNGPFPAIIDDL